ncbi:hypothetical protein PMAYCL1PPCAC_30932, partial [Pristionchus mayeri]
RTTAHPPPAPTKLLSNLKTSAKPVIECEDSLQLCCFWAVAGECDTNPYWMRVNCAKTCGTCECRLAEAEHCVSTGVNCTLPTTATTTTATTPRPTTTSTTVDPSLHDLFMTTTTPAPTTTTRKHGFKKVRSTSTTSKKATAKSTRRTMTTPMPTTTTSDPCRDYSDHCRFWAALGECDKNPFWMRPHCQKSCRSCHEQIEDVFAPLPREGCDNAHKYCTFSAHNGEYERN